MHIPRLVLAGTHSGVGKTTISTGIMAALARRGRPVQGYKVGPDYIDPSYHALATGRPSRNLDRWLLDKHLGSVFAQSAEGHWAVIEGVMGMFDGVSGTPGLGSTADIAKELEAPVLLIVDPMSMARSVAAIVHGFRSFDPQVNLVGVILNRVRSATHEKMLREALQEINVPILGCFPKDESLRLPERHLGLVPVGERSLQEDFMDSLVRLITEHVDLDSLEEVMQKAPALPLGAEAPTYGTRLRNFRLGIAWDEAFLFYYQDALDLLERFGFSLVPFSPLHDTELPPNLDAVMLGGGFPELHLDHLSQNHQFLASIRAFARSGKSIYAECGGYMYLGESITDFAGKSFPLTGIIPLHSEMTSRLQGLGYRKGVFQTDNFLGSSGTVVYGHEFHYSKATFGSSKIQPAYRLFKGDSDYTDGFARDNLVASYLHLHFTGHPELLEHWYSQR